MTYLTDSYQIRAISFEEFVHFCILTVCDITHCRARMFLPVTHSTRTRQSTLSVVYVVWRAFILLDPTLMERELPSIVLILGQLVTSLSSNLTARTGREVWKRIRPLGRGQKDAHRIFLILEMQVTPSYNDCLQ